MLSLSLSLSFLIWALQTDNSPKMSVHERAGGRWHNTHTRGKLPGSQTRLSPTQKGGPDSLSSQTLLFPPLLISLNFTLSLKSRACVLRMGRGAAFCRPLSECLQPAVGQVGYQWLAVVAFQPREINLGGPCYLQSHELATNMGSTAWVYEPTMALRPHGRPHNPC